MALPLFDHYMLTTEPLRARRPKGFIDVILRVPIFSSPSDHWQIMTRRVGRSKGVHKHECSGGIFSRPSNHRRVIAWIDSGGGQWSKVSGSSTYNFLHLPTSCRIQSTQCMWNDYQIEIVPVATFLIVFRARMIILFIVTSYWMNIAPPPQICWLLHSGWWIKFWACSPIQSILNTCLFDVCFKSIPNHSPLTFKLGLLYTTVEKSTGHEF